MIEKYYHICNPQTPEVSGIKNIYSEKELFKIKNSAQLPYLINIHLNWEDRKLSSNQGFDIATELRAKLKSKVPIIFYSPVQVKYFEKKSEKEIKYRIIFGRGSAFIEAPFTELALRKLADEVEPLSNASLHDVVTMLCDLRGVVIEKIKHDLRFGEDIHGVIASISPYLSEKQKELIDLNVFVREIKQVNNEKDFNIARELFLEKCYYELTSDEVKKPEGKKKIYKILFIDDVKEELEKAERYLKDTFEVITASTSKKAIDLLMADTDNQIITVVSDWRLFTDERKNYWQPLQGYEVLEIAAKSGIRALFALTSQANFLIHQLRDLLGFHFPLFQKQNLTSEGQWKVMSDALVEACEATEEIINSQPTSEQWTSIKRKSKDCGVSLKELYGLKRHIKDTFFSTINDTADEIWQTYLNGKNIRYSLGQLSTSAINVDVLKEVLIQRRIWIGLFLCNINAEGICELMAKDPKKTTTNSDVTQLKIKLCIVENDVKRRRILPEERAWLTKWSLIDQT
jgi:CheY-like chemotaxis protein